MDVIIQSLGFTAGEKLESFVKEKLSNLKSDNIVRANVTLYKGAESDPENNYCEIRLEVPGNDHFVKKSGANFESTIHECVDVLQQQIKKAKDKLLAGRQGGNAEAIADAIYESGDDEVDLEDVVK